MEPHNLSPMKQHPGGQSVLDYQQWAESTSTAAPSKNDSQLGTPGLKDLRDNRDPAEVYGRMVAERATKGDNGGVKIEKSKHIIVKPTTSSKCIIGSNEELQDDSVDWNHHEIEE